MRITFISPPPNLTGGIRVIGLYAQMLSSMGHKVTIVTRKKRDAPSFAKRLRNIVKKRRVNRIDAGSYFDNLDVEFREIGNFSPVYEDEIPDADVVIATIWHTAYMVSSLPASKGRKFFFVQGHEVYGSQERHFREGAYYLPLKKIVVSNWLRDVMRETYGDNEVSVVPNAVDLDKYFAAKRGPQKEPTVCMIYSKKHYKGTDAAITALNMVKKRVPELKVLAFGLQPPTPELPLPDYFTYRQSPSQDEIRNLYASSDAYLLSSRVEGFGLPILEAMACRCPVVSTRVGCAPEMIENGKSGFVAEIDDTDAMADGLVTILTAPDTEWRSFSNAAFEAVSSHSWEKAAKEFVSVLESRTER